MTDIRDLYSGTADGHMSPDSRPETGVGRSCHLPLASLWPRMHSTGRTLCRSSEAEPSSKGAGSRHSSVDFEDNTTTPQRPHCTHPHQASLTNKRSGANEHQGQRVTGQRTWQANWGPWSCGCLCEFRGDASASDHRFWCEEV